MKLLLLPALALFALPLRAEQLVPVAGGELYITDSYHDRILRLVP